VLSAHHLLWIGARDPRAPGAVTRVQHQIRVRRGERTGYLILLMPFPKKNVKIEGKPHLRKGKILCLVRRFSQG